MEISTGIIRLLRRAGFEEPVEEDSISYLSQLNPQLADVLQYLNEYRFTSQNFLDDSEVELYKEFMELKRSKGLNVAHSANWSREALRHETEIEEEINDMQDELKTLKDLHSVLCNNNSQLQSSIREVETKCEKQVELQKKLQMEKMQVDIDISSLSKQIDVFKSENLQMLQKSYSSNPDVDWINECLDKNIFKLEQLSESYENCSTNSMLSPEHIEEAEFLYEKWQKVVMQKFLMQAEMVKNRTSSDKANKFIAEVSSNAAIIPDAVEKETELALRDGENSQVEASQIVDNLIRPLLKEFADIQIRDSFLACVYDVRSEESSAILEKLTMVADGVNLLVTTTAATCFASIQESKRNRDLYVASKAMERTVDLLSKFKMSDVDPVYQKNITTIQKQDRLLWLLKEYIGDKTQLCSIDSLKQNLLKQISKEVSSDIPSTKSSEVQEITQNIGEMALSMVQEVIDGAAGIHHELIMAPKSLIDAQDQVRTAANDLRQKVAHM